jgi:chromosome segregation ATPase
VATKERLVVEILADLEEAKVAVFQAQLAEQKSADDMATVLEIISATASDLESGMLLFGGQIARVRKDGFDARLSRCRLEQALFAERQRILELRVLLDESGLAAREATEECAGLIDQLRKLVEDKAALEGQVCYAHSELSRTYNPPPPPAAAL